MSAERFRLSAGFEARHVPFKGGAEALTETIAGRVDYYFCPIATALPQIAEGRVLGLVVSPPQRASGLPNVRTTLEAGYADSDYMFWVGMFAPCEDAAHGDRPAAPGGDEGDGRREREGATRQERRWSRCR